MEDLFKIMIPSHRIKSDYLGPSASWSEADEYRMKLFNATCYLTLLMALSENGISNPLGKQNLDDLRSIVNDATDEQIVCLAPQAIDSVCNVIKNMEGMLPPKIPRGQIAIDFNELCKCGDFDWSTGIEYYWINQRFNCDHLGIPSGFPLHGIVGVGQHAGHLVAQEQLLLRDAYLVRARVIKGGMTIDKSRNSSLPIDEDHKYSLRQASAGVCREAKGCISLLFALVECLMNSVGENHLRANPGLPQSDVDFLRGKRNGRWITFSQRLEGIPGVVNGSRKASYIVTDPNQRPKDIEYLVSTIKPLRDSSVHYSVNKASIWLGPLEWLDRVENAGRVVIEVMSRFWAACYGNNSYPEYLHKLDLKAIESQCENWMNAEEEGWDLLLQRAKNHHED